MSTVKKMDIAEFRKLGYLQEINRLLLHPAGLALEIMIDDATGKEILSGVWDCREDPDGIDYGIAELSEQEKDEMAQKAKFVAEQTVSKTAAREKLFGNNIEQIN